MSALRFAFDCNFNAPLIYRQENKSRGRKSRDLINFHHFSLPHSSYEVINEIANFLLGKTTHRPKIGIICGSGLGSLAESMENADTFPYHTIPNFPVSTVEV